MKIFFSIYLLLTLLYCNGLLAQQFPYRQFGVQEGLADSRIFTIKQHTDGRLLISTDNGLSVYDGFHFKNYLPKYAAGSNFVLDTEPLPDGRVLVNAYKGGLCILERERLTLCSIVNKQHPELSFDNKYLLGCRYDAVNRCVWAISSTRTLWRLLVKGSTIICDTAFKHTRFYNIFIDSTGRRVFFGADGGLYQLSGGRRLDCLYPGAGVERVQWYNAGSLLLSGSSRVTVYQLQNGETRTLPFVTPNLKYGDMLYDSVRQLFWVPGSQGGLAVFKTGEVTRPWARLLPGVNCNHLFADAAGNTWCGAYGSGLFQFFTTQIVNYSMADGLQDAYITHISPHKPGAINISCLKTYYEFNTGSGLFSPLYRCSTERPGNKMYTLPQGRMLLDKMVILYDNGRPCYITEGQVFDFLMTPGQQLLTGQFSGIRRSSVRNGKAVAGDTIIGSGNIFRIIMYRDTLYAGTNAGLMVLAGNRLLRLLQEAHGMSDDRVHDIMALDGRIYCATRSGLSVLNENGIVERPFRALLGQRNGTSICSDARGGIWLGTMTGLFLLYHDNIYQFDNADGFISDEITALCTDAGYLYAGTTRGLSQASLDYLYSTISGGQAQAATHIEAILVNDSIEKTANAPLKLGPGENNIRYLLGGVNFANPRLYITEYSIDDGVTWQQLPGREISLRSLGFGSYRLQLRTRHRNQPVFSGMVNIPFTIQPPWYRKPVSIILLALSLSGVFAFLVLHFARARRKREQHNFAVKKQMLDLEQKAMAALLNPHFVFNAINSINYYIHNGEEEKYTRLLTDLSKLIRLNLNNTYKDSVTLESELEIVKLYVAFEQHRFIRYQLDFDVHYKSRYSAAMVRVPSMIIQPFVENAIWHGILPNNGGRVLIEVTDAPGDYIEVAIHDNGAGYTTQAAVNTGSGVRGMQLIQERLNAYNQLHEKNISFSIEKGAQSGSVVKLRFPVKIV